MHSSKPCIMHSLKPCPLHAFLKAMHPPCILQNHAFLNPCNLPVRSRYTNHACFKAMHTSGSILFPNHAFFKAMHSSKPCIHPALSFSRPSIPPNHTFPNSCNAVPMRQCSYISKLSLPNSYENLSRCAVTGSNALSLYLYISSMICRSRNRPRITHIVWSIPLHQLCSYPP